MKWIFSAVILSLTLALLTSGQTRGPQSTTAKQSDATRESVKPEQNYCTVIQSTVDLLEERGIFEGGSLGLPAFIRLLAFVETRDGEELIAAKTGGLWAINDNVFTFTKTEAERASDSSLKSLKEKMEDVFQLNQFFKISDIKELDKPLYSALYAVMYLALNLHSNNQTLANVPTDPNVQGSFYANLYHGRIKEIEERNNRARKFQRRYNMFVNYNCEATTCTTAADIIFVMDGSGSIGIDNFQVALNFIANLVGFYDLGPNKTQIGVLVYSNGIFPAIPLNEYYDIDELQKGILNISYPSGGTNTGSAIEYAVNNGFNSIFGARLQSQAVPRVLIVATDGQANNREHVMIAAEGARALGITTFSIGIGGGIDEEELLIIAGISSHVYTVTAFSLLSQITLIIRSSICRTQSLVTLGTNITTFVEQGDIKFLQFPVPAEQPVRLSFASIGRTICIYASFQFQNPGPDFYNFKWTVADETFTVSTPMVNSSMATSGRKRRQSPETPSEVLYLGIVSLNETASVTVDAEIGSLEDYSDLAVSIRAEDTDNPDVKRYSCIANCTCMDAFVIWEKTGISETEIDFDISDDGRVAFLNINTTSPDHYGQYKCIIRSPRIIGEEVESITFNYDCQNNGSNHETGYCLCPEIWTGDTCEEGQ